MPSHRALVASFLIALTCFGFAAPSGTADVRPSVDVHNTRMLCNPAISADNVAFIYADDLWVADLDGKNVRRLTTDANVAGSPVFAPDGKTIAFTGQYQGNIDVYVIPTEGGVPT